MLVTSWYVSSGMRDRKVSNRKSDIQGHSMVPFDSPHTISLKYSVATIPLSCTVNEILLIISQNLKRSQDSENIPFRIIYRACTSIHVCQLAYEIWSAQLQLQRYNWGKILKHGSCDPDHALGGSLSSQCYHVIYSTCIRKIWRLLLQPLRRCDRGRRIENGSCDHDHAPY